MASALIVTSANGDAPTVDGIFSGLSFFLLQRLPSRANFVSKIQSNGGRVVKLEAQADHVVADPYRKQDCPPGSISYTFIDKALENGALPEPGDHAAGPPKGTVRPVAAGTATKATRTPFTATDDRELYLWVKKHEAKGGSVKGNELYKQLQIRNPRHTFQAWRDRYIKKLMDKPPPAGVDVEAAVNGDEEETPRPNGSRQQANGRSANAAEENDKIRLDGEEYDQDEIERLVEMGDDIETIQPDRLEEAWEAFAEMWTEHSATAWRRLWDDVALAEYRKRRKSKKSKEPSTKQAQMTNVIEMDGSASESEGAAKPAESPERPSSSASLKRKRVTPTPRKQATYGRKKQKEGHDMFGEAASDDDGSINGQRRKAESTIAAPAASVKAVPAPQARLQGFDASVFGSKATNGMADRSRQQNGSDMLTSDANKAAAMQLDDEFERMLADTTPQASQPENANTAGGSSLEVPIDTSEANRVARMQPNGDVEGENLPASDVNRLIDEQLRNESTKGAVEDDDDNEIFSTPRRDTLLQSDGIGSQTGDIAASGLVHPQGNALTAANLATQDEQHRDPAVRGTDLPQDDEMQDQTNFIDYLQSLRPGGQQSSRSGLLPAATGAMPSRLPQDSSLTAKSNGVTAHDDEETPRRNPINDLSADDLPLTLTEELEEVWDEAFQWPQSPSTAKAIHASQDKSQDKSAQSETQIKYPALLSQQYSQKPISRVEPEELQYPELSNTGTHEQTDSLDDRQADFDREVLGIGDGLGQDSRDSVNNHGSDHGLQRQNEEEIDLLVAEPPEGFGFSSPQPRASQQETMDRDLSPDNPGQQMGLRKAGPEGGFGFSSSPPRSPQNAGSEPNWADFKDARAMFAGAKKGAIEITSSSSSSSSEAGSDVNQDEEDMPPVYSKALETQDIYNAATQAPEYDMPSPNPSFDDFPSSPISRQPSPAKPTAAQQSQAALADTQALSDDDVDTYINRMTFAYNYTESAVINALKCTSMRPDLAELVLLEGKAGKGLPADVPGIWSEEDDRVLEGGNAGALRELERKHGWRECERRLEWLGEWREGDGDWDGEDE